MWLDEWLHTNFKQEIEQKFQLEIVSHSTNTSFRSGQEQIIHNFYSPVIVINDSSKFQRDFFDSNFPKKGMQAG